MDIDLKSDISRITPELIALRRDFHQWPELAFAETRTSDIVAEGLASYGFDVRKEVAGTGVVGLLSGSGKGRTVAIRADMDALPITEQGDMPYKSNIEGVAHMCGHDGHTAAALFAASIVAKYQKRLRGSVKFIFQPAEETAQGALEMVAQGVMRDPKVDAVLSVHLWNYLPAGTVAFRTGAIFASVDELRIDIKGKGGHGAAPHQTIDPIPVAAQVILGLQHLVSRNTSPFQPAVVTIGRIQGGTSWNVIPETVSLAGTIRTYDEGLRDYLVQRAKDTVSGICSASGADYDFKDRYATPPVVNDKSVTEAMRHIAADVLGSEHVLTADQAAFGDDAAYFNQEAPGCYFLVGAAKSKGKTMPHHHPEFDFDEGALPIAVELLARGALELAGAEKDDD